jgi:hypothetical protein
MRIILLLIFSFCYLFATARSGEDIVNKMYNKYHGKWHPTLTFVQKTEFYRNDSLKSTQTWYEAIKYPKLFRIDIGSPDSGNTSLFRNDVTYRYKNKQLISSRGGENELIFLLGGIYFLPLDSVKRTMNSLHIDISQMHDTVWKGEKVYVIGSDSVGKRADQFWVDKKKLVVVRLIQFNKDRKTDAQFSGHVRKGESWVETKVSFYVNDKLMQNEFYTSISTIRDLPDELFHPATLFESHWFVK